MINLTREEAKQVLDALEKGAWDTLRGRNAADLLSARLSAPEKKFGAYEALWLIYIVCMIATALFMMAGCTKNNYESCVEFHEKHGFSDDTTSIRCYRQ